MRLLSRFWKRRPRFPSVCFLYPAFEQGNGSWYYRSELPSKYLAEKGWPVEQNPAKADIVCLARAREDVFIEIAKQLKKAGKKLIYEIDDDLWALDVETLPSIETIISLCDAVSVTTEPLKEAVQKVTGARIFVVPNYTEGSFPVIEHIGIADPTLFVSGSLGHAEDFEFLYKLSEHPKLSRFRWLTMGLQTGISNERCTHLFFQCLLEYRATLAGIGKQNTLLGLVPLKDSLFNRSKSDLKWREYTVAGIPAVYSDVAPYQGKACVAVPPDADIDVWAERILYAYEKREEILVSDKASLSRTGFIDSGIEVWQKMFLEVASQ